MQFSSFSPPRSWKKLTLGLHSIGALGSLLHEAFCEVAELFDLLTQMELTVNESKSASLLAISGTRAFKVRKTLNYVQSNAAFSNRNEGSGVFLSFVNMSILVLALVITASKMIPWSSYQAD